MQVRLINLEGVLHKRGEGKGLGSTRPRKRYFKQRGRHLYYYKSIDDLNNPLGFIDISDVNNIREVDEKNFELHTPTRTYQLSADSKTTRFWVGGLRQWKTADDERKKKEEEERLEKLQEQATPRATQTLPLSFMKNDAPGNHRKNITDTNFFSSPSVSKEALSSSTPSLYQNSQISKASDENSLELLQHKIGELHLQLQERDRQLGQQRQDHLLALSELKKQLSTMGELTGTKQDSKIQQLETENANLKKLINQMNNARCEDLKVQIKENLALQEEKIERLDRLLGELEKISNSKNETRIKAIQLKIEKTEKKVEEINTRLESKENELKQIKQTLQS